MRGAWDIALLSPLVHRWQRAQSPRVCAAERCGQDGTQDPAPSGHAECPVPKVCVCPDTSELLCDSGTFFWPHGRPHGEFDAQDTSQLCDRQP